MVSCGVGLSAEGGVTPLSGVGISADPLDARSLLSALRGRMVFSIESRRTMLGGRLSRWRSGTGLGSLGGSAGSTWLCPLATWFPITVSARSGGSWPNGFLGNSSSLPAEGNQ